MYGIAVSKEHGFAPDSDGAPDPNNYDDPLWAHSKEDNFSVNLSFYSISVIFTAHSHPSGNLAHSPKDLTNYLESFLDPSYDRNPNMRVDYVQGEHILYALVVVDKSAAKPYIKRLLGKPSGRYKSSKNLLQDIIIEGGDLDNPVNRIDAILTAIGTSPDAPIRLYASKGQGFFRVTSGSIANGY